MRFRLKLTLCMLALLSLLLGVGGSFLISSFFRDSLQREKDAAFASYRMVWGAMQIVSDMDPYLAAEEMVPAVEQLYTQNSSAWAALRLATQTKVLYESDGARTYLGAQLEQPEPGACLLQILPGQDSRRWLLLSGAVTTYSDTLYLYTVHDITDLYTMRHSQQQVYLRVFLVLSVLCAAGVYPLAKVLTGPLTALSRATRAIASGDYSSRVKLSGEDEVSQLAADFDRMAEELESTISALREAAERRERFVGSFAHEMKTPMTSLIGYAQLLRGGTLTESEQAEAADYIYSEGRRLERLSRRLLELLELRQGGLTMAEVSPAELAEEMADRLRPLYAQRGAALRLRCEEGRCLLEPELTRALLLNLLDNAVKSMDQGGEIDLTVELLPDGCRLTVADRGRGIPEGALKHLTEEFYRVDKARSRSQGGFGLGLTLCREIAEAHRGTLRFANREGGGAVITAELRGGRP